MSVADERIAAHAPVVPHLLIRASAGTGKTFALSSRYLKLLFADTRPETILATTFTRKAAGEILERILLRLSTGGLSDANARELASQLELDRELTGEECRGRLHRLVNELHLVRVSTLDAFFAKLGQAYALELRLPPGWRILEETEQTAMRMRAIDRVLTALGPTGASDLLHLLEAGDTKRDVLRLMLDAVNSFLAAHLSALPQPWTWIPAASTVSQQELDACCESLAEAAAAHGKRYANAAAAIVKTIADGDLVKLAKNSLVATTVAGEHLYYKKPTPEELRYDLATIGQYAAATLQNRLRLQTESTGELLEQFATIYAEEKQSLRGLEFDDITRSLGQAEGDSSEATPSFGYRMDGEIRHLMLDEFQDTSFAQWDVLRPIATAAVRNNGSVFCVGDVKQAIYGWRGGVAAIFDAFEQTIGQTAERSEASGPLQTKPLDLSYRSSPVVIDTVNQVFGQLDRLQQSGFAGAAAIPRWQRGFREHATTKTELSGYAAVLVGPSTEETADAVEADRVRLNWVADVIAERAARRPTATIGVLVRRKAELVRVAAALRSRGVEVSEEGGQPLTDSAAVLLLVSLLKLTNHPGDTLARFHVSKSPLASPTGLQRHDDDDAAAALSQQLRASLATTPLAEVIREWVRPLIASCGPRDLSRLRQLVALAREHETTGPLDVDEFLRLVERSERGEATDVPVSVLTIHASKGLEFDTAILLELDGPLASPHRSGYAAARPQPASRPDRLVRYVGAEVQALLPPSIREVFDQSAELEVSEGLCLFYVAATRAKRELLFLVDAESEEAVAKRRSGTAMATRADILRDTLNGGMAFAAETVAFEAGTLDWTCDGDANPRAAATPEWATIDLSSPRFDARGRTRRSPSQFTNEPENTEAATSDDVVEERLPQRLRAAPRGLAPARGSLMHRWLEEVVWLDDAVPADEVINDERLHELANFLDGPPELTEPAIRDFRSLLTSNAVADVLRRDRYLALQAAGRGVCDVWTEQPFAVPMTTADGSPELLTGSIDRLVLLNDASGGSPVAAEIIDWKTDRIATAAELRGHIERYTPQMAAYREAVHRMTGLPTAAIDVRLVFLSADRTVAVERERLDRAWSEAIVPVVQELLDEPAAAI